MLKIKEIILVFSIGSIGYMFIEILWRGFTHWSMGIAGGISFLIISIIEKNPKRINVFLKGIFCTVFITSVEFFIGVFLNLYLGLNVWDYSRLPLNFLGQISLLYSIYWYALCIPSLYLCKILRHRIFSVWQTCTDDN